MNHRVWELSLVKEQKAASKARTDRSPSEQNQSTPLASSSCSSGCKTGLVAGYCVTELVRDLGELCAETDVFVWDVSTE